MTAILQAGFRNNINAITIRGGGARSHVYTDRAIDVTGDGVKEAVVSTGAPTGTGSKVQQTVVITVGSARTIVDGSNAESVNTQDGDTYYTLGNT